MGLTGMTHTHTHTQIAFYILISILITDGFQWATSKTTPSFTTWKTNHPDDNKCAIMDGRDRTWRAQPCSDRIRLLCQYARGKRNKIRDLFKVKLFTIRSESKKKREKSEIERDFK